MEDRRSINEFPESYPMNEGDGAYSYAQNSRHQVSFSIFILFYFII
jgi:hypothetical protein